MDNIQWFKQAQYGMMIHWGLYSLAGGEWKGRRCPRYAEWLQFDLRIPNTEYETLLPAFNPVCFSANEWVSLAKRCGMQYIVITSKHHDGFALFDSKVDDYNVVKATPFGRDVIAEMAEACYKHGVKLGLYYSQELDWHHPHGGGYPAPNTWYNSTGLSNFWDYPETDKKDFSIYFNEKCLPQVQELLQQYKDLLLIWFDVPGVISKAQSQQLYDLVKSIQPQCLINSRLGNGVYDYVSLGDNEIPDDLASQPFNDPKDIDGNKPSVHGLYETAATINDTYAFKYFDHNWKNAGTLLGLKNKLNGQGINYLLNVGPDGLGRIPSFSQDLLLEVAEKI